jgi:hypothetical protein
VGIWEIEEMREKHEDLRERAKEWEVDKIDFDIDVETSDPTTRK